MIDQMNADYKSINFLPKTPARADYFAKEELVVAKPVSLTRRVAGWLRLTSWVLMGAGILLAVLTFGPQVYEQVSNRVGSAYAQVLTRPGKSFGQSLVESGDKISAKIYQPAFDATLPVQNRLVIDSIGFDAPIGEEVAENVEETLKKGAWRVGDFGTPFARKYPTILAAHRYGYLDWSNAYRREHSFYNLPKLKEGDRVEIIWNQRRYVYEITEGQESKEITNYQADLILYTCKFLDSKMRVFKYAKLVEV